MESFHAVLRSLVARIQQIPLRIPTPEQVIPATDRRGIYGVEPTRWGQASSDATRSYLDDGPEPGPPLHPRRLERSSHRANLPWRWCAESLGIQPLPTPRGLLTCQS